MFLTRISRILFICLLYTQNVIMNRDEEETTKEIRPEYRHPDGLLNFDPYIQPEAENDFIPLPEKDEVLNGQPIFLLEPKSTYILKNKPASILCRAANALEVYFNCNEVRIAKTVQQEHVDPHDGVRVIEAELNITKSELERTQNKYICECYAWNSKGNIRSQPVVIELAYIKKQFVQTPISVSAEAGTIVRFQCLPPLAVPPATVKWTRNGVNLNLTDKTLVFPKVALQDMANFTCVAENIAGRRESEVAVLSVYVNGGWSEWSPWMPCYCDGETKGRRRMRSCTKPAPTNGGAPCRNAASQTDDQCISCSRSGSWTQWSSWSDCSGDCVRIRRRQCTGNCVGPTTQHAACVGGLCSQARITVSNATLYVAIGITVGTIIAGLSVLFFWCRFRNKPGYSVGNLGIPKTETIFNKDNATPDLTRTCNDYWIHGPDNHYEMPSFIDSYAYPFGNRSRQTSPTGSNHYEMKPYSSSVESASSGSYTNTRTMTSRSSEYSSQIAELTASPISLSKVDVAVTLPSAHINTSYRDKIRLTILK